MTLSVRGCEGWVDGPPEVTADTVWPSRAHLTASRTTPPPCCGLGTRSGAPAPGASPIRALRAEGSRDPASSTAAPTPVSGLAGETGPPRQPEATSCARAARTRQPSLASLQASAAGAFLVSIFAYVDV